MEQAPEYLDKLPDGAELMYNPIGGETPMDAPVVAPPQAPAEYLETLPEGAELKYNMPGESKVNTLPADLKKSNPEPSVRASTSFTDYIAGRVDQFTARVKSDYQESVRQSSEAIERGMEGEQTMLETSWQMLGDAANLFSDVVGGAVVEIAGATGDGISVITPDFIEEPVKEGVKAGWDFLLNTEQGQAAAEALSQGLEAWTEFEKENPRAAENLKSVVDVGAVLAPTKVKPRVDGVPDTISKAKLAAEQAKMDAKSAKDQKYFFTFNNPKDPEISKRTIDGKVKILPHEQWAVEATQTLKGYGPLRSNAGNLNVVNKELARLEGSMDRLVADESIVLNVPRIFDEFGAKADARVQGIAGDTAKAELQKHYVTFLNVMEDAIATHGNSAKGILMARRAVDAELKRMKGDPAFNKESLALEAARDARNTLNDNIASVIPETRTTSQRMSGLYHVQDNLSKDLRAGGALERIVRAGGSWAARNRDLAFPLAALGLSYATTAPVLMAITGGAGLTYLTGRVAYKGLTSPQAKQFKAAIEEMYVEGLKKAKPGSDLAKQLKADRATALTLIRDLQEMGPEETVTDGSVSTPFDDMTSEEFAAEQKRLREENEKSDVEPLQVEVNKGGDILEGIIERNKVK